MDQTALDLQQRILAVIARGVAEPMADEEFDRLAREVFAFQFEQCAPYRAYCDRLKLTPQTVAHWKQIPAVPASAFKDFALTCFPVAEAVAEFHTSGTTRESSGKHYLRTLELYEAAIVPNFAAHLLADEARLPMMVLTPSPQEAPHSSLSHMMGVVMEEFGAGDSAYYVEGGQLLVEKLVHDLCEAQWASQPVFLLGTTFAFVHLFEHLAQQDLKFELSRGSRAMETGGFKGRAREVSKMDLYEMFEQFLGIPKTRVVNEYGMTELSTQFYEATMSTEHQTDCKTIPPWARVVVIDPNTGSESAKNQRGLIRVFDLANVWSIMCVQTEDLGVARTSEDQPGQSGFEILGRAAGVEVRGCSLNAESFLRE
jgi:hypothetical protein